MTLKIIWKLLIFQLIFSSCTAQHLTIATPPENTTACRGSNVTISCGYVTATAFPVTWIINGTSFTQEEIVYGPLYQLNNPTTPMRVSLTVFSINATTTFQCMVQNTTSTSGTVTVIELTPIMVAANVTLSINEFVITVSWQNPIITTSTANIIMYNITIMDQYSPAIVTVPANMSSVEFSYNATSIVANREYIITVSAISDQGMSCPSDPVVIDTFILQNCDVTSPSTGTIRVSCDSSHQIQVTVLCANECNNIIVTSNGYSPLTVRGLDPGKVYLVTINVFDGNRVLLNKGIIKTIRVINTTPMIITTPPENTTVCRGSDVTISCGYMTAIALPVTWIINGTSFTQEEILNSQLYQWNNPTSPRTVSLTVFSINGTTTFQCVVHSTPTTTSTLGTVTVTNKPTPIMVTANVSFNINMIVITVSWQAPTITTSCTASVIMYNITVMDQYSPAIVTVPANMLSVEINHFPDNDTSIVANREYTISVSAISDQGRNYPSDPVVVVDTHILHNCDVTSPSIGTVRVSCDSSHQILITLKCTNNCNNPMMTSNGYSPLTVKGLDPGMYSVIINVFDGNQVVLRDQTVLRTIAVMGDQSDTFILQNCDVTSSSIGTIRISCDSSHQLLVTLTCTNDCNSPTLTSNGYSPLTVTGLDPGIMYSVVIHLFDGNQVVLSDQTVTKTITVMSGLQSCTITSPSANTIRVSCELLERISVTISSNSCTCSQPITMVDNNPITVSDLPIGVYTVEVTAVNSNDMSIENNRIADVITVSDKSIDSSSSDSNSQSIGAVVAIVCVTFIVTLIATAIITFLVTYIFVKQKFAGITQDTTGKQPIATTNAIVYDTVSLPGKKSDEVGLELQPNPAYSISHKVIMDTNPVYESCK